MITQCPHCKTRCVVAGGREKDSVIEGKSISRIQCHACHRTFEFKMLTESREQSYGGESYTNPLDMLSSEHPYPSIDLCLMGDGTIRDKVQVID